MHFRVPSEPRKTLKRGKHFPKIGQEIQHAARSSARVPSRVAGLPFRTYQEK